MIRLHIIEILSMLRHGKNHNQLVMAFEVAMTGLRNDLFMFSSSSDFLSLQLIPAAKNLGEASDDEIDA